MLFCTTPKYFCFVTQDNTIKCTNLHHCQKTETKIISNDVIDSIVSLYDTCSNEIVAMTHDSEFIVFNINSETYVPLNLDVDNYESVTQKKHDPSQSIRVRIDHYRRRAVSVPICFSTQWLRIMYSTSIVKKINMDLAENEKIKNACIIGEYLLIRTNLKTIINTFRIESASIASETIHIIYKKYKCETYYYGCFFFLNNSCIDVYNKKFECESFALGEKFTMDHIIDMKLLRDRVHILGKMNNKLMHLHFSIRKKNDDDIVINVFGTNFYLSEFYSCEYDLEHIPNLFYASCGHLYTCICKIKYTLYSNTKTHIELIEENTKTKSCFVMDYQIKNIFVENCNRLVITTDEGVVKYYTISRGVNNKISISHVQDDTHLVKYLCGKNTKKAQ